MSFHFPKIMNCHTRKFLQLSFLIIPIVHSVLAASQKRAVSITIIILSRILFAWTDHTIFKFSISTLIVPCQFLSLSRAPSSFFIAYYFFLIWSPFHLRFHYLLRIISKKKFPCFYPVMSFFSLMEYFYLYFHSKL